MYHITEYTKKQARSLGVTVKPSKNKNKKIDVIKNGDVIASVGFLGANDYPTYLKTKGKSYADKRRKLYKMRHEKDRHIKNSNGFYADKLLW